jgi:sulfur-carrier protein
VDVTVRYFAGARAAAGMPQESVTLPPGTGVDALLGGLAERHGDALARVLQVCSVLVDGVQPGERTSALPPGAVVDVLPPFAGG